MKLVLCSFLLIFSVQSFAKNIVQSLLENKSGQSPFEILEQFHNTEGHYVSQSDLNYLDLDNSLSFSKFNKCVKAKSTDLEPRITEFLVFGQTKIIPAVPPQGPLFPGTPELRILRTSIAVNTSDVYRAVGNRTIDEVLDNSHWGWSSTDGMIFRNDYQSYFGNFDYNFSVIKGHGDLISFFIASYKDGTMNSATASYGYCWNE